MASISYKSHFPEKSDGKSVAALQAIVKQCAKELAGIQKQFHYDTLRLSTPDRTQLAEMLIDFAFDLQCNSGIWSALEKYNTNLFGTPLPLIQPQGTDLPPGLCLERVLFLLWNFYPLIEPGRWLSHRHVDMLFAAEEITDWLTGQLPSFPKNSPVKKFLTGSNDYGWEVKRKLIWLGTHSWLFRMPFEQYFEKRFEGKHQIAVIDDFLCQQTTPWSGMGAIDILAECLDVPDEQKNEIRIWYMRHFSYYKIVKADNEVTEAVNLINDVSYRIREGSPIKPSPRLFKPGMTVYGSLVPWRGEWYWSGEQYDMTPYSKTHLDQMVAEHKQKTQIVARFWPEREKQVRERMEEEYQSKMKHYGNDLTVLPNGRSWEREETKRLAADMAKRGFMGMMPRFSIPEHLLNCKTGIGIYLDPVEGMEMMEHFNAIRSGLKKNGKNCTPDEGNILRIWLDASAISPGFIHRALKEYGGEESIKQAICWETDAPYWLDYLLRCRKGEYYRKRFPPLDIVASEKD
jgi:hypothetical protein